MNSSSQSGLSFKDRRNFQRQRLRSLGIFILVLGIYISISTYLITPWTLKTQAMAPGYLPGTRILVVQFLLRDRGGRLKNPPGRGDIVSISSPYIPESAWPLSFINSLVRFFTLQKVSPGRHLRNSWENERIFKRVIGIPGDTIRIRGSVAYIKPQGEKEFLSEFELNGMRYDLEIQELPEDWNDELPLYHSTDSMVLDENQYYVLGDNRRSSNDSRYWGPVSDKNIRGRGVFAYWPIKAFGYLH